MQVAHEGMQAERGGEAGCCELRLRAAREKRKITERTKVGVGVICCWSQENSALCGKLIFIGDSDVEGLQ